MQKLSFHYDISADDYTRAGEASSNLKKALRKIGLSPELIRRVAIAMYEGEINMVIHANGGTIDVEIDSSCIDITLTDTGKGIENVDEAMKEGFSTASDQVRSLGFGAGMGLPNMKKHSDYMRIESVSGIGTTVHLKISIIGDSD